MDEIIDEERKERLKEHFARIADKDVLTNGDALMIIEILRNACERKQAEVYEDIVSNRIERGGEA